MRRPLIVLTLAAAAGIVMATAGAGVADAGTPVSFTIASGGLSIAQPAAVSLGTYYTSAAAATITGSIGSTTVTDLRTGTAGWTTTIAGTATFADTGSDTVVIGAASVWVGATGYTTTPALSAVPSGGTHITQLTALTLTTGAQNLVTATTLNANTVTFNPSIAVVIPAYTPVGTYTATITQTVS